MSDTPDEWDPLPHERIYYRNVKTMDRGWLVRRDAQDFIRMDRGPHEELRPFREGEWTSDTVTKEFTVMQVTQVAYAADRQLCRALGLHDKANKDWMDLPDAFRHKWMRSGPPDGPEIRKKVYDAIMAELSELTG